MHRLCVFFALSVIVLAAGINQPAYGQAFSGTTGTNSVGATGTAPQVSTAAPAVPQVLPPVFQGSTNTPPQTATLPPALPASPAVPAVPTAQVAPAQPAAGQLDASTLPADPCAAYLNSYDIYAVCQDRVKRLSRMQELKEKREADVVARRKAIEDRKKAEAEAKALRANQPKFRRPGEVAPPPKQPQQVQIVPSEDSKK